MNHHNHRESRIRHWASCGEYPTLAHFRHFRHFSSLYFTLAHFRHFSSLFTPSPLYICRESSTNQLLFMQNKPNFRKSQMNVSIFSKMAYEYKSNWTLSENKPNSNPIKPNLLKDKTNATLFATNDYRKKDDFVVRIIKLNFQNAKNECKLICYRGL